MFNWQSIKANLATKAIGKEFFFFEKIDSTNVYAKSLSKENAPHGTVIIAEEQTAGRGRLQRKWIDQKERNLLFSILLYPEFGTEKIHILPFVSAVAVVDALAKITELQTFCKWPNDILMNNKKICGMLIESVIVNLKTEKIIIGIGVNVNQNEFPEELQLKATSLRLETGKEWNREELLKEILEQFEIRYEQLQRFDAQNILNDWKQRTQIFGKRIFVIENEFLYEATAKDIAHDGSLIIELENGKNKNIYAGDVTLHENY